MINVIHLQLIVCLGLLMSLMVLQIANISRLFVSFMYNNMNLIVNNVKTFHAYIQSNVCHNKFINFIINILKAVH